MKKKDNRGMSLVELIIVIAILGIVIGMTGYGLALVSKKPVDECAKKIEMVLNQNRTNAMGNTEAYVGFYLKDNKVTVTEHLLNNSRATSDSADDPNIIRRDTETVIGAKDVNIRLYYGAGPDDYDELPSNPNNMLKIGFRRDSGSVVGFTKVYTKIVVYKGTYVDGTYVKTIELDALTGKVKLQ
ncbi:MAG: type II secretion system GspH family protein [Acetatifactor sp.]|nr:type II secretion system GspH family protein [Acetatifactor sp.]MDE5952148.1 type II secretion system GspH family protein [Acetatifactor sp.]